MSWNDPSGSGFHSESEKTNNRNLRDQIDTLHQNYEGSHGWDEASAAVAGSSSGKYDDKLMNDDHLNKMIAWLSERQKSAPKPEAEPKPKPEATPKPIEYSPEIQEAKERVQAYEAGIQSGETSDEIYNYDNDYSKDTYIAQPSGDNFDYSFDSSKGVAGIGTHLNGSNKQQTQKATASFLDKKKSQVKNTFQI